MLSDFILQVKLLAHLVGFTNVDDTGQEGLELAYDHWLKGEAGEKRVFERQTRPCCQGY